MHLIQLCWGCAPVLFCWLLAVLYGFLGSERSFQPEFSPNCKTGQALEEHFGMIQVYVAHLTGPPYVLELENASYCVPVWIYLVHYSAFCQNILFTGSIEAGVIPPSLTIISSRSLDVCGVFECICPFHKCFRLLCGYICEAVACIYWRNSPWLGWDRILIFPCFPFSLPVWIGYNGRVFISCEPDLW